jgi:putative IMPACT (imprinted ancient) family translation regulator
MSLNLKPGTKVLVPAYAGTVNSAETLFETLKEKK